MKTPSTYPVLDNRPIDQWRVTELKEELKRRRLMTRGLKEDLVKRLDEALRNETESLKEDAAIIALDESPQVVGTGDAVTCPVVSEASGDTRDLVNNKNQLDGGTHEPHIEDTEVSLGKKKVYEADGTDGTGSAREEKTVVNVSSFDANITIKDNLVSEKKADIDAAAVSLGEKEVQEAEVTGGTDSARDEDIVVNATSGENIAIEEDAVSGIAIDVKESQNSDSKNDGRDSKSLRENEDVKLSQEDVDLNSSDPNNEASEVSNISVSENVVSGTALTVNNDSQDQRGDLKSQLENEEVKLSREEVDLNSSDPNQVSEVSTVLGFQVKSDSISSDCVSINEKNELKDNIIDDNVKLELDVMPEMVQPSSSNVLADGGKLHPMDVEEPHENKAPVEERDVIKAAKAEMNKKNDGADVTSSEKLNLDRSSGEDYLEEDALENKQIDSKYNSDDVEDRSEKTSVLVVKEEAPVDIMLDDNLSDKKYIHDENKNVAVTPTVKRKLHDQELVGNNEASKRQRRWNTENLKVPEPVGNAASTTTTTTPKDSIPSTKRNFSRSNSTVSEDAPKERMVPPSPKPPTNSLRIDRFLRPFTLKAVQELLGKTGNVTSFWMDHIKTHCYVTYSSVEEATETRNAVYNLQWPPNGGRLLLAEFVDPQEVKMRLDGPPQQSPATPVSTGPTVLPAPSDSQPPAAPSRQVQWQQLPPPPPLLPPPPPSNPPPARERHPPPPPPSEKVDPPIVTLDDLFR